MLRQVFVYFQNQRIYFSHFGKALDEDSFASVFKKLQQEAFTRGRDPNAIGSYDFYKYRISFIAAPEKEIVFIFVTDLTDSVDNIKTQLQACRREFLELFESVLGAQFDKETFEVFQPTIEKIHKELRPKISLVGFSGVGKTTITRLIRAEEIPMEHVPTITGEIGTIKIGKLSFALWDFAGQEQFSFLWNKFVKGSDAVLLITDSTLENVEKSRFFSELVKQEAPHAHLAIIGNKQDLPGAMPSMEIERILGGIHAYSMVATDPHNRDKMITIIADILEMSSEVSPLLKPLIERDKKMVMAEQTLMGGDFQGAFNLFNQIADLCLELGDDSLSAEFHQKADKVKGYLSQMGQTSPTAAKVPDGAAKPLIFEGNEPEPPTPTSIKPPDPIAVALKSKTPSSVPVAPSPVMSPLKHGTPPASGEGFIVKPSGIQKPPPMGSGAPIMKPIPPPAGAWQPAKPAPPSGVGKPPVIGQKPSPPPTSEPAIAAPLIFSPPPDDLPVDGLAEPSLPKPLGQLKVPPSKAPAFKPTAPKPLGIVAPTIFGQESAPETPNTQPVIKPAPIAPQMKPPAFSQPASVAPQMKPPAFSQPASGAPQMKPPAFSQPAPVAPQIKPPAFAQPTPIAPQIKPPAFAQPNPPPSTAAMMSSEGMESVDTVAMKRQINATLMDLKIKVANMNKFLLEIEMKNLTGEMLDAEFEQKKQRAEQMKAQLMKQMAESQELLKSMG